MGICYGLYHRESKTYLSLGKRSTAGMCFNGVTAQEIEKFLIEIQQGTIELLPDSGNTPNEEVGWTEINPLEPSDLEGPNESALA